ncbi:MAG: hypothetical protein M3245_02855 [Actinomycetota bacterium]|nr:hypothetical protein [Actinomycetota bacterium]
MNWSLLGIYLNDHLAGSVAGRELAKRCMSNNRGTPVGDYLARLVDELAEDQAAVRKLLRGLDVRPGRVKPALGWAAEKVGRLKLNGQLTGYSPLSRLEELEALYLGVEGKLRMWRALAHLQDAGPPVGRRDVQRLIRRAEAQLEGLERHRLWAAERVVPSPARPRTS